MYFLWPMLLALGSNIFYNIVAKSTPQQINPFASLFLAYLVGAIFSLLLYFFTAENQSFLQEVKMMNWTTIAMGICVVGIETGYLFMYRAGWSISSASVVANILLAIALLFVGIFLYKETISIYKIIGIALCIIGLIFINKK
ncbi:MAG: EamA family transporter [Clostridiales bacterium]